MARDSEKDLRPRENGKGGGGTGGRARRVENSKRFWDEGKNNYVYDGLMSL